MQAQAVIVPNGECPEMWRLFTAGRLQLGAILAAERILGLLPVGPFNRQGKRIFLKLAVTTA